MTIITPRVARIGVLASITLGIGMLSLYAMVISGHEASHALPAEEHAVVSETDGLLQEGGASSAERLSFQQFMQRVKAKEDQFSDPSSSQLQLAAAATPQDDDKMSAEVDALGKMAKAAKVEVATSSKWAANVVPLDKKTVAATKKLIHSAESEEAPLIAKRKDASIKEIQDIAASMSRTLDSMPAPPPGPPPAAPVTQSQAHTMVKKAADNYAKAVDEAHAMLHPTVAGTGSAAPVAAGAAATPVSRPAKSFTPPSNINGHTAPNKPAPQTMPPLMVGGEAMPPLPPGSSCADVLKLGEAACRLHFWQAMDACTSETLAPKEALQAPACVSVTAQATKLCEDSLDRCGAEKATTEAKRLRTEIMQDPNEGSAQAPNTPPAAPVPPVASSAAVSPASPTGSAPATLAATTLTHDNVIDEKKLAAYMKEQMQQTSVLEDLVQDNGESGVSNEDAVEPLSEGPKLSKKAKHDFQTAASEWTSSHKAKDGWNSEHDDLSDLSQLVHEIKKTGPVDEFDEDDYADGLSFDITPKEPKEPRDGDPEIPNEIGDFLNQFSA
jgi:hypothetical protein